MFGLISRKNMTPLETGDSPMTFDGTELTFSKFITVKIVLML